MLITLFQGTASVVLAGLIASQKLLGGTLADHKFLFLGAGEVNYFMKDSQSITLLAIYKL